MSVDMGIKYTLEGRFKYGDDWKEFSKHHSLEDAKFAADLQNTDYQIRNNEEGGIVWQWAGTPGNAWPSTGTVQQERNLTDAITIAGHTAAKKKDKT